MASTDVHQLGIGALRCAVELRSTFPKVVGSLHHVLDGKAHRELHCTRFPIVTIPSLLLLVSAIFGVEEWWNMECGLLRLASVLRSSTIF